MHNDLKHSWSLPNRHAVVIAGAALLWSRSAAAQTPSRPHTLSEVLALAQRRALLLTAARWREAAAGAKVRTASGNYYPTLAFSLSGGGSAVRDAQPVPPPGDGLFSYSNYAGVASASATLRWTAFDFGKTSGNVASARADQATAVADRRDVALGVMSEVADAYLTLFYRQRLRDDAKRTLEQRERATALAHGLVTAGIQPPLDELRASSRAEVARLQLSRAEAAVVDARAVLAALLVMPAAALQTVASAHLAQIEAAIAKAPIQVESLPSVRAARADYRAKKAAARAAAARYLPTLSVDVDAEYKVARYGRTPLAYTTRTAIGSLVVSMPLFDATLGAAIDEARAEAAAARAVLEQGVRDARQEAVRATAALAAASRALLPARRAADGATAVLEVVQARYAQGLSSPIELIDAETADTEARNALVEAELDHGLALVRACKALGRPLMEDR